MNITPFINLLLVFFTLAVWRGLAALFGGKGKLASIGRAVLTFVIAYGAKSSMTLLLAWRLHK